MLEMATMQNIVICRTPVMRGYTERWIREKLAKENSFKQLKNIIIGTYSSVAISLTLKLEECEKRLQESIQQIQLLHLENNKLVAQNKEWESLFTNIMITAPDANSSPLLSSPLPYSSPSSAYTDYSSISSSSDYLPINNELFNSDTIDISSLSNDLQQSNFDITPEMLGIEDFEKREDEEEDEYEEMAIVQSSKEKKKKKKVEKESAVVLSMAQRWEGSSSRGGRGGRSSDYSRGASPENLRRRSNVFGSVSESSSYAHDSITKQKVSLNSPPPPPPASKAAPPAPRGAGPPASKLMEAPVSSLASRFNGPAAPTVSNSNMQQTNSAPLSEKRKSASTLLLKKQSKPNTTKSTNQPSNNIIPTGSSLFDSIKCNLLVENNNSWNPINESIPTFKETDKLGISINNIYHNSIYIFLHIHLPNGSVKRISLDPLQGRYLRILPKTTYQAALGSFNDDALSSSSLVYTLRLVITTNGAGINLTLII
jgi:hypothetical protein